MPADDLKESRKMAKFALVLNNGGFPPIRIYEGDYMEQELEYVKIFKNSKTPDVTGPQVAAIHLDKNHSIILLP
jgi:hypothetical protein